jgi:hypothetical protein
LGGMKRIFGHRRLSGSFKPLFEIQETGFTYKGRPYVWPGTRWVLTIPRLVSRWPLTLMRLSDGAFVWLDGRAMEEEGKKPSIGVFSARSDAYDTLLEIFKTHE